jgi:hypothetical protein
VARQPATAGARPDPSVNRNDVSWVIDGDPLDVDPVDVVARAAGPVRCGVEADPVHVLESDHLAAVVHAVDREPAACAIVGTVAPHAMITSRTRTARHLSSQATGRFWCQWSPWSPTSMNSAPGPE